MIGAQLTVTGMDTTETLRALFSRSPVLLGSGIIGTKLSASAIPDNTSFTGTLTYQWYGAEVALEGQTSQSIRVSAELDAVKLKCIVTARCSGRYQSMETPVVQARYPVPVMSVHPSGKKSQYRHWPAVGRAYGPFSWNEPWLFRLRGHWRFD